VLSAADDPNVADWISAIGQALGALFTAVAVGVALWIAHRDARQRRHEESEKSRAQARLILLPNLVRKTVHERDDQIEYKADVLNVSERPIVDVTLEVMVEVEEEGVGIIRSRTVGHLDPLVDRTPTPIRALTANKEGHELVKWRLIWQDPDGRRWEIFAAPRFPMTLRQRNDEDFELPAVPWKPGP
jgi:hypothetical protein